MEVISILLSRDTGLAAKAPN